MKTMKTAETVKDKAHVHFYTDNGVLYETYRTIRGLRYRKISEANGMPDSVKCSEITVNFILKENNNNKPKKYKNV